MQQLLDQSLGSDSWSPPKIKFNWDASYWTKQISSFGKVRERPKVVEGVMPLKAGVVYHHSLNVKLGVLQVS